MVWLWIGHGEEDDGPRLWLLDQDSSQATTLVGSAADRLPDAMAVDYAHEYQGLIQTVFNYVITLYSLSS